MRWPEGKRLPNAELLAARSLVGSDGWPWLLEQVEGQITSIRLGLTDGRGAGTWDEYQYLLGVIAGLSKLTDLVDTWVDPVTGDTNE